MADIVKRSDATVESSDRPRVIQGRVLNPRDAPRTEYVLVQKKDGGQDGGGGNRGLKYGGGFDVRWRHQNPPSPLPRWLGSERIIFYSWVVGMIIVGFDEWHNLGILPRPARLWDTSIVYGLLAITGLVPVLLPLANAFALGYTFMLLWQYYNGSGQFSSTKKASS